ncbi:hypothetical protein GCM10022198_05410 [Klugiella xanthotipulae]|uniref:Transcriptional regulator with AbiEi antitoxin domain of type IV toxin-antitoxin system n=1 Tax=Klugiella xanthotipulae TaxID=244735 RepID=A0A543HSG6_9MICO|nr:hypothetical protein FB466_2145 [Klugiella xanthotipulae]
MKPRLPSVITTLDMHPTELSAAVLQGELVPCGLAFLTAGTTDTPIVRAKTMSVGLSPAATLERFSAAWVYACTRELEIPVALCVSTRQRKRLSYPVPFTSRQVVLAEKERLLLGGVSVTTPLRTVCDILLVEETWSVRERVTCRLITQRYLLEFDRIHAALEAGRHPRRQRALKRLALMARASRIGTAQK